MEILQGIEKRVQELIALEVPASEDDSSLRPVRHLADGVAAE